MSSASKSKFKDKRTGKESTNVSGKRVGSANGSSGVPASAYNLILGSFHALELESSSSASSFQSIGRFRSIDENDQHDGNSVGTGGEFDNSSNNGSWSRSWSGESEEQKDKPTSQSTLRESVPGAENDKREKIRQKNERKHQRQKERRAQELQEKCRGYLTSRKLEYLSQELVAMGFSAERATMALILNEGKVDQTVTWLLDEGAEEAEKDEQRDQNFSAGGNLKIDISDELARIADLEIRYKCSKQEVEKAVVACEGDIEKAAETLKTQKQEPLACPPKPEEAGDPPAPTSYGVKDSSTNNQYLSKAPPRPNTSTSIASQLRDERDFNYTRTVVTPGMDNSKKDVQLPKKRAQPQSDWTKPQQIVSPLAEQKWPILGTSSQVTGHVASLQVSPQLLKTESWCAVPGSKSRNAQQIGTVQEPVTVMQRQQPHCSKPFVVTSIATPSWQHNGGSDFANNGVVAQIPSSRSFSSNNVNPNQSNQQQPRISYQHQLDNNPLDSTRYSKTNGAISRFATSSTLAPASSLGLFSGTITPNITNGSSSPVGWSNGYDMGQIDYANIDWSLDRNAPPLPPSKQGGISSVGVMGLSSNRNHVFKSGNGMALPLNPLSSSNRSRSGSMLGTTIPATGGGFREAINMTTLAEWSSPFEENDIFSLPRQFVSSHSMYERP